MDLLVIEASDSSPSQEHGHFGIEQLKAGAAGPGVLLYALFRGIVQDFAAWLRDSVQCLQYRLLSSGATDGLYKRA